MNEPTNIAHARRYLQALEAAASPDELRAFFTDDVLQREYPNRLTTAGASRDMAALLASNERGRAVVSTQRYDVRSATASGDTVALEVDWSATLRVPVGTLAAGDTMRASLGIFLGYRDGKICSQRNYDCFEPF